MEVDTKIPLILGRPFLSMTTAHIDAGVGVIQLNINGQKERFGFRPKDKQCSQIKPKDKQCSQIKSFNRKEFMKELEKPYTPSNSTLIEFVENLRTPEEIKVYNQWNAKRNIQRKKFLEFGKKEIEITYGWRKRHHQHLHQVTTTKPKVCIVSLGTRNPSPCHEVRGSYPLLHLHIG